MLVPTTTPPAVVLGFLASGDRTRREDCAAIEAGATDGVVGPRGASRVLKLERRHTSEGVACCEE